jgi:hypothetical protein
VNRWRSPPPNDVTNDTERPLEYLVNLDDPGALGDVTRWALKTIEEREPDDPKPDDPRGSWIAQWVLERENAEFPLNDDVAGRLETLREDFRRARYDGGASDAQEWNSILINEFMEKFATQLNIEPRNAVEPAEPPGDAPSAYSSAAQHEPRAPSERVVTWQGPPERFKLKSLYPWSETREDSAETRQERMKLRATNLIDKHINARDYGYPLEEDVFAQTQNDQAEQKRIKELFKQRRREEKERERRTKWEAEQPKDSLSQER